MTLQWQWRIHWVNSPQTATAGDEIVLYVPLLDSTHAPSAPRHSRSTAPCSDTCTSTQVSQKVSHQFAWFSFLLFCLKLLGCICESDWQWGTWIPSSMQSKSLSEMLLAVGSFVKAFKLEIYIDASMISFEQWKQMQTWNLHWCKYGIVWAMKTNANYRHYIHFMVIMVC